MSTTTINTPSSSSATEDYAVIRTSVGVYPITAPLAKITGENRLDFLDGFLSRSSEFVEPDTVRECLTLNADGSPFAILLHLELNDETWLLPRTPVTATQFAAYLQLQEPADDVTVEVAPDGRGAVAFEGPLAWKIAEKLVDFDVSGLILHAATEVTPPGGEEPAPLARVGTTSEYGYLLLTDAPEQTYTEIVSRAVEVGGAEIGTGRDTGLARVQSEAGMPHYSQGLEGLSISAADLAWMIDWERIGDFYGSDDLAVPARDAARLTALAADHGSIDSAVVAAGTPVLAGDTQVGSVAWLAAGGNDDEELIFAVLDHPFWASGLTLTANGVGVRTVSLPRVVTASSQMRIG